MVFRQKGSEAVMKAFGIFSMDDEIYPNNEKMNREVRYVGISEKVDD